MKIAFIYDRINTPHGGAEKVLLALHQAFPDAPFFTSVYDQNKAKWAKELTVIPSFLQSIVLAKKHHRQFAPLMPIAFENLSLKDYDVVVSVTSAEAIGVITAPHQLHICYLLSPPHYLFSHEKQYRQSEPSLNNIFLKFPAKLLLNYLKKWYRVAASRPDVIIPISQLVAKRCEFFFHRKTKKVLYPPVEITQFTTLPPFNPGFNDNYYLCVSRLLHYKRIDLAINACHTLKKHLVIIGDGPQKKELLQLTKQLNSNYVHFIESANDELVNQFYENCLALIMPGEEDFGITGLEANSHGKPAIIYSQSGIAEILEDKKHAIHFKNQTVEALMKAITESEQTKFDQKLLRQNSTNYDTNIFVTKFKEIVNSLWKEHSQGKLC